MKLKLTKVVGIPGSAIPINYWAQGYTDYDWKAPEEGKPLSLKVPITTSKGEKFDWFRTTLANFVYPNPTGGWTVVTKNSTWKVEVI